MKLKGVESKVGGSSERYDGKTRKDDLKKWVPIMVLVIILFVGLQVGLHFLKKSNAADYVIVDMCNGLLTEDAKEHVQQTAAEVVGDKDENGKIKISMKEVLPAEFGGYDESAGVLFTGDYVLFLMLDPNLLDENILAKKVDLTGTDIWESMDTSSSVYACILNTDEDDMIEAEKIIESLQQNVES